LIPETIQLEQNILPSERAAPARNRLRDAIGNLYSRDVNGQMTPFLRRLNPFALEAKSATSLLVIEDLDLFKNNPGQLPLITRASWKNPPFEKNSKIEETGGEALVVYLGRPDVQSGPLLPREYIFIPETSSTDSAQIHWNVFKDINPSKYNHISNQPFYLRRYARRVAALWQKEYNRYPSVHAITGVSFNGRPYQPLVDPGADLAAVPASWFRHNSWVNDLQTRRIPRESLDHGLEFVGN
jgi:hypothetical protein